MKRLPIILGLLLAVAIVPCLGATTGDSGEAAETAPVAQEVAQEEKAEHMEVGPTDTCDSCHAEYTEEIHQQWFASKHGLNNVKCFVCHGTADDSFTVKPEPDRCIGCHFDKVESLATPFMEGKDCFSCHPSHLLSPHRKIEEGESE